MEALWAGGHAAYVVGGSLRDALLGREPSDWDLTTDARPERIQELFPRSLYENRFGTVVVRRTGTDYEITTFRHDIDYSDHRRPRAVEFGATIEEDLARRDFTVNAIAWGSRPEPTTATRRPTPKLVDPFGGHADVEHRVLRAVGRPIERFEEDALRMIRAVRLAATLEFTIDPDTLDAIAARAELVQHLSGERIAAELLKLLGAKRPSVGLGLLAETGMLAYISPELAEQRGVRQAKIAGDDLWAHTLRTVDAAPPSRPIIRLAALVHDIGKPATAADGHFYRHEVVGAEQAENLLRKLRLPRATIERVVHLVRYHMFSYNPSWSDAAIRRFIGKVGKDALDELFALREADNVGSGLPVESERLAELRARVEAQLEAQAPIDRTSLAIDGNDLITELGMAPGRRLGRVLEALLERVIEDPSLNDRATLLMLAQPMLAEEP